MTRELLDMRNRRIDLRLAHQGRFGGAGPIGERAGPAGP